MLRVRYPVYLFGLFLLLSGWLGIQQPRLAVVAQEEQVGNIDFVLIIDTSGSMSGNDPAALRVSAAKLFVDLASDGDKIGVVSMTGPDQTKIMTDGLVPINGRASREDLKTIIEETRRTSSGGTYMGDALNLAYDLLEKSASNEQRLVLLLTDGLPDPAAQFDEVDSAIQRFATQPEWPVFAVALGSKGNAEFMEQSVTSKAHGQTLTAVQANELVDLYLRLFEQLADDRYIEEVTAEYDGLVPIATLLEEQRLSQVTMVVHRSGNSPSVEALIAPNDFDYFALGINDESFYNSQDKAYELVTVFDTGSGIPAGEWQIQLDSEQPETRITLMARSGLRTRLIIPRPSDPDNERSVRFVPAGRDALFRTGALDEIGGWSLGMTPEITLSDSGVRLPLLDDGVDWDFVSNNGSYTGIFNSPVSVGKHNVQIEVPTANSNAIHLYKNYPTEFMTLPNLKINVISEENGRRIRGELLMTDVAGISVNQLIPSEVWVIDPAGNRVVLNAEKSESGDTASFVYEPNRENGDYLFRAIAHIDADDGTRQIPYSDFAKTGQYFEFRPQVTLTNPEPVLIHNARFKSPLIVDIASDSWRDETIEVTVETDLPNTEINPKQVQISADEPSKQVVLDLFTDAAPGQEGSVLLRFASAGATVDITSGSELEWVLKAVSQLSIRSEQTEMRLVERLGGEVVVYASSRSPNPETVAVVAASENLEGITIVPDRVTVPPGEEIPITFRLHSSSPIGSVGNVSIRFGSENDNVALDTNRILIDTEVVEGRNILRVVAFAGFPIGVIVGALFLRRRLAKN